MLATRDYARPQRPKNPPPHSRPAPRKATAKSGGEAALGLPLWAWMVVSMSLIVFAAALYYVSRPVAPMDMAPSSKDKAGKTVKAIEIPPKEPSRFAFYEMLPSYEVVVPEEVLNPTKPKPGTAANNLPAPDQPVAAEPVATATATRPAATKPALPVASTLTPAVVRDAPPQPTAQLAKGEQFLIQVAAFRSRADAEQRVAALTLAGLAARVEKVTIDNKDTWYRVRLGPYGSVAAAAAALRTVKAQGFDGVVMKVRS